MSSKIEEQKQWSLHSVETMSTGRLLHKGTILRQTTVVLLQKKKKKTFAAWKYWKELNWTVRQNNLSKKPSSEAFLRPWIWPNIGEL